MKEIEHSLKTKNITEVCYNVVNYVCKNKVKDLIRFYINQFASFYISNNIHVIFAIWKRLKRISDIVEYSSEKELKTLFNKRSVRINICELYVILGQMNRPMNALQFRNTRQKFEDIDCPMHFTIRSENGTIIDVHNFLYEMKIPHHKFEMFKKLVYVCTTFQNNQLCNMLNGFLNDKDLNASLEAYNESIYELLFRICNLLCLPERRHICKITQNMFNLYNNSKICNTIRFNLLLMCYDYSFCHNLYSKYEYANKYVKPIVIQTAIKIDYIYCENQKDFPKLSLSDNNEKNNSNKKDENGCEEKSFYEIVLFSTPFTYNNRPKPYYAPYRYDRTLSKMVDIPEIKSNKIKYNIKKNNEQVVR